MPVSAVDAFRPGEELPAAEAWTPTRPGEIAGHAPSGAKMGRPGPDQGYALKLATLYHGKLRLADGEHEHDVIAGCLGVALKRAALFGRAPVVHDLELAFAVFGFTGAANAPAELRQWRATRFESAGHHYEVQRAIADAVPDATLRLTPEAVKDAVPTGWRNLFETD